MQWKEVKTAATRKPCIMLEAPSYNALAAFAAGVTEEEQAAARGSASTAEGRDKDWDFGLGFKGACDMGQGRTQWLEGKDQMEQAQSEARARMKDSAKQKRKAYAVAGGSVNVARFVAGNPLNMRTVKRGAELQRPVVTVVQDTTAPAYVTASTMAASAAACLALTHALTRRGYRVRAYTAFASTGPASSYKCNFVALAPMLSPGAALNLSRVAFQAMHPASSRRIGFAAIERAGAMGKGICSKAYGTCFRDEEGSGAVLEMVKRTTKARHVVTMPAAFDPGVDVSENWDRIGRGGIAEAVQVALEAARAQGLEV